MNHPTLIASCIRRFGPSMPDLPSQICNFNDHQPTIPMFNPTTFRNAVDSFQCRQPPPFRELLPTQQFIQELRRKRASYEVIAELLTQHSLPTSKSTVAAFCHQVLQESVRARAYLPSQIMTQPSFESASSLPPSVELSADKESPA